MSGCRSKLACSACCQVRACWCSVGGQLSVGRALRSHSKAQPLLAAAGLAAHTVVLQAVACHLQVKSFAVRKWLAVNAHGEVRQLELAKMRVTAGLGVQLRDLRWVLHHPAVATHQHHWLACQPSERRPCSITHIPATVGSAPLAIDSFLFSCSLPAPASTPASAPASALTWHLPLASHLAPLPGRLLDPQLATSYPSAILARERAIVVNLEFIKCIISMGGWASNCCLWRPCKLAAIMLSWK